MQILVTGFSRKQGDKGQVLADDERIAFIRVVAKPDQNDTASPNTIVQTLQKFCLEHPKIKPFLENLGIRPQNIRVEGQGNGKNAALVIGIKGIQAATALINSGGFWSAINKVAQHPSFGGVSFVMDKDNVMQQLDNGSATKADYDAALGTTQDFLYDLFQKLETPEAQQFLQKYTTNILPRQYTQQPSEGGWEHVQFSSKNSLMVLAQYMKRGVTPTFACSARDWTIFNRKVTMNAKGAVVEVPKDNKRLDTNAYNQKTQGGDFNTDISYGGSTSFKASWIGYNQHDAATKGFDYGWVFDISETELMTDANGQPLPDVFNDPKYPRRETNLGDDLTMAFGQQIKLPDSGTTANSGNTTMKNDLFQSNVGLADKFMENIAASIGILQKKSKKGSTKYDTVIPQVQALIQRKNCSPNDVENVVKALANCELYNVENRYGVKDNQAKVITNVVMLLCGIGTDQDMANNARRVISNKKEAYSLYNGICNIVNLMKGTLTESLLREDEIPCEIPTFQEFLHIIGLDDGSLELNEEFKRINTEAIFNKFNNIYKKLI